MMNNDFNIRLDNKFGIYLLLLVIAFFSSQRNCSAQSVDTVAKAAELAKKAEKMALGGKTQEALAEIALAYRDSVGADAKVKLRLLFTIAWLQQQLADEQPKRRNDWLKRAAVSYSRILRLPGYETHRQTRENLSIVNQQLGKVEKAVELLAPDDKSNPQNQSKHNIMAGDLLFQSGKFNEAFRYYKAAKEKAPNDPEVNWKIVAVFPYLSDVKSCVYRVCVRCVCVCMCPECCVYVSYARA